MKIFVKSGFCLALMILFIVPLSLHSQVPVVVNDTIDITPGFEVRVNLLANDTIPAGDSVRIVSTGPSNFPVKMKPNPDNTCTFLIDRWGLPENMVKGYKIWDVTNGTYSQPGLVVLRNHDHSADYLDINNVKALFNSSGLHFFRENAEYEVPKGSGKMSLFANTAWIGGNDPTGMLHFAGEQYRQGTSSVAGSKHDFWAGPVSDSSGYNIIQDTIWNRVWKINKSEIDYHRAHFWEAGYVAPVDILTWPAHGDVSLGQAAQLAPFSDRNANGKYEPYDGDYPEIRGDQALFFIYNDDHGYHSESTGVKLKVEVHGMAYAFDRPGDTAFKNTTFLHLKFYNRSNY
ncbi:MAG: hypothetical protein EOM90_09210, partial [Alphaproteobacteria bacterium]|nr:hypothetical protein [Alphaproteobacteria bacterium]